MHKGKASQDRYICDLFILKKKGQKNLAILHTTQF